MNNDPVNSINTSKNQQKKAWTNHLKDILDQAKQSIDENKSEHPTGTLAMTFQKPAGEANIYVQFGYSPQTIYNTPEYKFQRQWILIQLIQTNRSTFNDEKMKTKTPNKNTLKWNFLMKPTLRNNI